MKLKISHQHDHLDAPARNREKILNIIESFPGIRYNDLARLSGLNNGTLSHHLDILEKNSIIRIKRFDRSNMTRYFSITIPWEETLIIGFLKIKSTNEIIKILLEKKSCTFMEVVYTLNKSPSTVSFHIKKLVDGGLLIREKSNNCTRYKLHNPEYIVNLTIKMRDNLFDRCIDSFEDLINDL